jgi:hypothetical protein
MFSNRSMPKMAARARLGALFITAAATGLAGCSSDKASDAGSDGLRDYASVQTEFEEALKTMQFPEGLTPPSLPKPNQATLYDEGYGTVFAEIAWLCAWKQVLVSEGPGSDTGETALDQLAKGEASLFVAERLDEAGRGLYADNLAADRSGDVSGFASDVELNCS